MSHFGKHSPPPSRVPQARDKGAAQAAEGLTSLGTPGSIKLIPIVLAETGFTILLSELGDR